MTSIRHVKDQFSIRRAQPVSPAFAPVISVSDRAHLEHHFKSHDPQQEPFLAHILRNKLDAPEIPDGCLPENAVCGGSTVTYRINDEPAQIGLLSHHSRTLSVNGMFSAATGGVIPGFSLLGATLIGMRVGQRAPLLHADGSLSAITVLDVAQPA